MRKHYAILTAIALTLALCGAAYAASPYTKLTGEITAIDYVAKTLEVAGTTVYTTDLTTILIAGEPATFGDLQVGQTVQVVGKYVDDQFVAKRICVQNPVGDANRYRGERPAEF